MLPNSDLFNQLLFDKYILQGKGIRMIKTDLGMSFVPGEDDDYVSPIELVMQTCESMNEYRRLVRDGEVESILSSFYGAQGVDSVIESLRLKSSGTLVNASSMAILFLCNHMYRRGQPYEESVFKDFHLPELIRRVLRNAGKAYRDGEIMPIDCEDTRRAMPRPDDKIDGRNPGDIMRERAAEIGTSSTEFCCTVNLSSINVVGVVAGITKMIGSGYMSPRDPVGLLGIIGGVNPLEYNFVEHIYPHNELLQRYPLHMLIRLQQLHDAFLVNRSNGVSSATETSYYRNATRICSEYMNGEV